MRSDIREGETFPDYELADQSGRRRSLSELQGGNPMVLHLSRGGFDPKEHQFVGQLVDVIPSSAMHTRDWPSSRPTISSTSMSSGTLRAPRCRSSRIPIG